MQGEEVDKSGLEEPSSLDELQRDFESCGGYLRRKGCSPKKPSILLNAQAVLELAIKAGTSEC